MHWTEGPTVNVCRIMSSLKFKPDIIKLMMVRALPAAWPIRYVEGYAVYIFKYGANAACLQCVALHEAYISSGRIRD